jgi:hypothetical protein
VGGDQTLGEPAPIASAIYFTHISMVEAPVELKLETARKPSELHNVFNNSCFCLLSFCPQTLQSTPD